VVDFLIQHGADVQARTTDGQLALHRAAYAGQGGIVELLLRHHQLPYRDVTPDMAKLPSFADMKDPHDILSQLFAMDPHDKVCLQLFGQV
jgi:ankyrin repeat protein